MDKKLTKKVAARIFLAFIVIMAVIFMILSKIEQHHTADSSADATTKTTEDSKTQNSEQANGENSSNTDGDTSSGSSSENAASGASGSDMIDTRGMTTKERDSAVATLASDLFIDTKQGEQTSSIGRLDVHFDSDYAYGATLSVSGITMDAVLYHDGNQDDLKGVIGNVPLFKNVTAPDSVDQCKKILEEYIPDGTGRTSEWEEVDGYFVRKISGYDSDDSCAVVYYTVVPKKYGDANVYTIVLSASKADSTITPLSEESFHSMMDPVAELVPDSKLLNTDYESSAKELKDIAYYETSREDESFGGLYQLRKAARDWTETVYGTDDPSTLTEEDRKDKYWQYIDPEGYREAKYYEAQAAAADNSSEDTEDASESDNSDTEFENDGE